MGYEVRSVEGFVQQLVLLVRNGYLFYARIELGIENDPAPVDRKVLEKYQVSRSKFAKYRDAKAGLSKTAYIRCGQLGVILATHGKSPFFASEKFQDFRRRPLKFAGYSLSFKNGHAHVCIEREQFLLLRRTFRQHATRFSVEQLERSLAALPFEPYAGVRRQLFQILSAVNRARREFGLDPVPWQCLRLRRRSVRVFGPEGVG